MSESFPGGRDWAADLKNPPGLEAELTRGSLDLARVAAALMAEELYALQGAVADPPDLEGGPPVALSLACFLISYRRKAIADFFDEALRCVSQALAAARNRPLLLPAVTGRERANSMTAALSELMRAAAAPIEASEALEGLIGGVSRWSKGFDPVELPPGPWRIEFGRPDWTPIDPWSVDHETLIRAAKEADASEAIASVREVLADFSVFEAERELELEFALAAAWRVGNGFPVNGPGGPPSAAGGGSNGPDVAPRPRKRPAEDKHRKWAEQKAAGLSYGEIVERHKDETGETVGRDAVIQGVNRLLRRRPL